MIEKLIIIFGPSRSNTDLIAVAFISVNTLNLVCLLRKAFSTLPLFAFHLSPHFLNIQKRIESNWDACLCASCAYTHRKYTNNSPICRRSNREWQKKLPISMQIDCLNCPHTQMDEHQRRRRCHQPILCPCFSLPLLAIAPNSTRNFAQPFDFMSPTIIDQYIYTIYSSFCLYSIGLHDFDLMVHIGFEASKLEEKKNI